MHQTSLAKNHTRSIGIARAVDSVVDLSGGTARYIAVEILTNHGDTYQGGRVGFSEVAFTPEPATMGLLAIGGLALLRRRRRA